MRKTVASACSMALPPVVLIFAIRMLRWPLKFWKSTRKKVRSSAEPLKNTGTSCPVVVFKFENLPGELCKCPANMAATLCALKMLANEQSAAGGLCMFTMIV